MMKQELLRIVRRDIREGNVSNNDFCILVHACFSRDYTANSHRINLFIGWKELKYAVFC